MFSEFALFRSRNLKEILELEFGLFAKVESSESKKIKDNVNYLPNRPLTIKNFVVQILPILL